MEERPITVPVRMDAAIFRNFAIFDTLHRRRKWVQPSVFSLILLISAVLCFVQSAKEGAVLLGTVLCVVAIVLPGVYFGMFFYSVSKHCKALSVPRPAYTVKLGAAAITAVTPGAKGTPDAESRFDWVGVHGVWCRDGATYLYVSPSRAFILPDAQVQGGASALQALCRKMLPAEKLHAPKN